MPIGGELPPPPRGAVAYRANREDLEPLVRLLADLLALAALARGRRAKPVGRKD